MKKLITLMFAITLLVSSVLAFDATRTITGTDVTINVDITGTTGFIVDENIPIGVTPSNIGQGGIYDAGLKIIRWTKSDNSITALTYSYSGSGIVSGTITGGSPASQKTILGDTELDDGGSPEIKINEFESNPSSGNEWIELYNPNAESVDISGWKLYDGLVSESLIYTIPASTSINSGGYYVVELSSTKLNNPNDFITLKDDSDADVDETPTLADNEGDDKTWQRIPDGVENWQFEPSTRDATNEEETEEPEPPEPSNDEDDLMVNYVRGKVTIDGGENPSGSSYQVEVLDGVNQGYVYEGEIDDLNVYLTGNGYFDTSDQTGFNTGASFRVSVSGYDCEVKGGIFENGGNGNFQPEEGLVEIFCEVNDAPELDLIGPKNVNENELLTFTITATDPDDINLIYEVENLPSGANFNPITRVFSWTPTYDDGNDDPSLYDVTFEVSDGDLDDFETITITVNNVNRKPVLESINPIEIDEGDLVTITANANDPDEDVLTYDIDNLNFIQTNNIFEWQTDYDDSGVYNVEITVTDGDLSDDQIVTVTVNNANQPPELDSISDININEDSGFTDGFDLNANDPDGTIDIYEVAEEDLDEVDCEITDLTGGEFGVAPADDWFGTATCTIRVYDNENDYDEKIVNIIVANENDAPVIDSYNPVSELPKIPEDGTQDFSITWSDIDNMLIEVTVEWFVDNVFDDTGDDYTFTGLGDSGRNDYIIKAVVDDDEYIDEHEWTLTTSDVPIADTYDGDTTDFTGMDDNDLLSVYLVLEKTGFGKIEFLEPVDMRDVVDLDRYADIQDGLAGIDTFVFPTLKNKRVRVTLYGLEFEKTPTIYYNSGFTLNYESINQICSNNVCSNIEYNSLTGTLIFEVESFSTFKAGDTLTCSQQNGFIIGERELCKGSLLEARDTDACCSIRPIPDFQNLNGCESEESKIKIRIKDPNDNEEFMVGETVNGEIKIENNFDEDKEFEVEIFFYDFTDDDEIDEINDDIKIDDGDSEKIDFEVKVDEDLDEGNDYYIYVKVYDEDDEDSCNEDYIRIDVEREKDEVIIEKFTIEPETVMCGKWIYGEIKVKNTGTNDQDVYVEMKNSELNINEESRKFELEEFGDDDEETVEFNIKLPEDVGEGEYIVKANVIFNGDRDSEEKKLVVEKCVSEGGIATVFEDIILGEDLEEASNKVVAKKININKFDEKTGIIILIISLFGGIILVSILIGIISKR